MTWQYWHDLTSQLMGRLDNVRHVRRSGWHGGQAAINRSGRGQLKGMSHVYLMLDWNKNCWTQSPSDEGSSITALSLFSLWSLQLGLHSEWLSLPLPDNRWYHGLELFLSDMRLTTNRAISLLVPSYICSLFYWFFSFFMGSDQFRVAWAQTCKLGVGVCSKLYIFF